MDLLLGEPPLVRAHPGAQDVPGAANWAARHRHVLRTVVAEHGCVLIRGLGLRDAAGTRVVCQRLAVTLMDEREAVTPRPAVPAGPAAGTLYAATPWPPRQRMRMHHELSYRLEFPGLLLFACLSPAARGGETALADATAVLEALPADLVERFEREGWILDRAYHEDAGVSWEETFGTSDREAVESYCRANAIELAWDPDGTLRTRQRRSAVVRHPVSGRRCWFNQVAFLSEWALDARVREHLVDLHGADGLPFRTRFGHGDPVGEDVVHLLHETYEARAVPVSWQAGDLLLADNVRTAHSREPYEGPREMLVGLAEPVRLADCA